jgi:glutathione S-transferase
MTEKSPVLMSHTLCPYVQRVRIALDEKQIPYQMIYIDLADKPDWFLELSPLGKTPVLKVGETAIFESAVILEYLEDAFDHPLHPADVLKRAEHRSWIELASATLSQIWGFYAAPDASEFEKKRDILTASFSRIEEKLTNIPYFDGEKFSLVDAAFAPVFRYFDVFDTIDDFGVLSNKPKTALWRTALAARPTVQGAVSKDYSDLLRQFLLNRQSHLSSLIERTAA